MRDKSKSGDSDNLLLDLLEDEGDFFYTGNSKWGKPQGSYHTDLDAKKKLKEFYRICLKVSQIITFVLVILIFTAMIKMTFFTTYEIVILDDSSQLFCTLDDDGAVAIAY